MHKNIYFYICGIGFFFNPGRVGSFFILRSCLRVLLNEKRLYVIKYLLKSNNIYTGYNKTLSIKRR